MQESVLESKSLVSACKSVSCLIDTQTQSLSVILPVLSTLNEKDCKPFWNRQCSEIQPLLWLPQKIVLQDQGSSLSDGLLNYQADESRSWMTRITPLKPLIPMSLSVSLPRSATATTESVPLSVPLKGAKIVASKRIRIYPENEPAYRDALALYRRSYNLAVERFRNDKYKDENGKFINMRPSIKAQVEKEQKDNGRAYNSIISDNGTLAAATTFKSVCSKNKKFKGASGGFSEISFKSRKGSRHLFSIDRLPKGLNPCVNALGRIHLTEEVPAEAIGKSCVITCDKGRWFI